MFAILSDPTLSWHRAIFKLLGKVFWVVVDIASRVVFNPDIEHLIKDLSKDTRIYVGSAKSTRYEADTRTHVTIKCAYFQCNKYSKR